MRNKPKKMLPQALILISILAILLLSNCKGIAVYVMPTKPKLSDIVDIEIRIGDIEDAATVTYQINELSGTITTSPYILQYNTCNSTGTYHESLSISVEVTYNDASVRDYNETYDLTESHWTRDDDGPDYSIYVARDDSHGLERIMFDMSDAFMDEFDSKSKLHYYWSENHQFTWNSINRADAVDLVLCFGHGSPHKYVATRGDFYVDLSKQAYSSCAHCDDTGDLEYMVFCCCNTLNLDMQNSLPSYYYWCHLDSTKLQPRPFSGLHAVMGFQHHFAVFSWGIPGYSLHNGDNFIDEFAENLDDGLTVRGSWINAIEDELTFQNSDNLGAVFYIWTYANETVTDYNNDYILGNPNYNTIAADFMMQ